MAARGGKAGKVTGAQEWGGELGSGRTHSRATGTAAPRQTAHEPAAQSGEQGRPATGTVIGRPPLHHCLPAACIWAAGVYCVSCILYAPPPRLPTRALVTYLHLLQIKYNVSRRIPSLKYLSLSYRRNKNEGIDYIFYSILCLRQFYTKRGPKVKIFMLEIHFCIISFNILIS